MFYPLETISRLTTEFGQIPAGRKALLEELAAFVGARLREGKSADLIFICTHNSRRSHISQLWASVGAAWYRVSGVRTFSGGTEATAFNPRAVKALQKIGFRIEALDESGNPRYRVSFSSDHEPEVLFSKKYDHADNPQNGFAAVMTCTHADENCPIVTGAAARLSLPYNDPKDFDGTELEAVKYSERVEEIGRELLYAFSMVKK